MIIFDMDGTLAKWENVPFEETLKPGYFSAREPQENLVAVARRLIKENYPVRVDSRAYNDGHSATEKREWLKRILPELQVDHIRFSEYGSVVPKEGGVSDILTDDYTPNLREFAGTGIKFRNGVNGYNTGPIWDGFAIDYRMSEEALYSTIVAIYNYVENKRKEAV